MSSDELQSPGMLRSANKTAGKSQPTKLLLSVWDDWAGGRGGTDPTNVHNVAQGFQTYLIYGVLTLPNWRDRSMVVGVGVWG